MANTWDHLNRGTFNRAEPVWIFDDERHNKDSNSVEFEDIIETQERTLTRLLIAQAPLVAGQTQNAEPVQNLKHSGSDGRHLLIGAVALLLGAAFSGVRLLTGAAFETGYPLSYAASCVIGLGLSAVLISEWRARSK